MAYNTVIQQGYFTSDGADKVIPIRSDVDWVEVHNLTNIAGAAQWAGTEWYWQRGMTNDDALVKYHAAATQALSQSTAAVGFNGVTYRGVSLIDSSSFPIGAPLAIAAGTNVTTPIYTVADASMVTLGAIVRINDTAHENLNGLDFTALGVGVQLGLTNALQQAPGVVAGANGTWTYIAPNVETYNMFNPKTRVICNITSANPGVVTTLVDHGFTTGQKVRILVPAAGTMTQLNNQIVTVTSINASTFSIGVDTTGYTAFTFPLAAAAPGQISQVIPIGVEETHATFIGIILGTSTNAAIALASPGGTTGDVIKWRAGKSFAYDID